MPYRQNTHGPEIAIINKSRGKVHSIAINILRIQNKNLKPKFLKMNCNLKRQIKFGELLSTGLEDLSLLL